MEHIWNDIVDYLARVDRASPSAIQYIISISMKTLQESLDALAQFGFILKNDDGTYCLSEKMKLTWNELVEWDSSLE